MASDITILFDAQRFQKFCNEKAFAFEAPVAIFSLTSFEEQFLEIIDKCVSLNFFPALLEQAKRFDILCRFALKQEQTAFERMLLYSIF